MFEYLYPAPLRSPRLSLADLLFFSLLFSRLRLGVTFGFSVVSFYPFKSGISFTNLSFTNNVNSFYNVLGYIVTQCHNMDEFVGVC